MNPRLALLAAALHAHDRVHQLQRCPDCGATWEGDPECWWCARAAERQLAEQRRLILTPPVADRGPRYDQLSDIDKAVWDHTRGNTGEGSMMAWAERLAHAVTAGTVTPAKAEQALQRAERQL